MKNKFLYFAIFLVIAVTAVALTIHIVFPKPPLLKNTEFSQAIYDKHEKLLRLTISSDEKYRIYTPLKKISPLVIQSTLLQEDRYFYQHPGVNPLALLKAIWQTYIKHARQMGASTITMQLARLYYGIDSKTIAGKLLQILYALQLELFYSKNQILEAYLNLAPYGGNIEGVGAASLVYFGKSADQLTLAQALLLSVIPQNPAKRSPTSVNNKPELQQARQRLFSEWIIKHPLDSTQKKFMSLPLQFSHSGLPFFAAHFVDGVMQTNPKQPLVITTLDLKLQKILENTANSYLKRYEKFDVKNLSAILVDTRDMEIKSLLGSGDFFAPEIDGQVNGTAAKRSPGSSLKPFIYALALDQGLIHPYTMLKDSPTQFGAYDPENFDNDFIGPVKAKDALTLSRNIPAIYLMSQLKHPTFYEFLKAAHITKLKSEKHYGLSLALGGAEVTMQELVGLYAMLANGGNWRPLRMRVDQPINKGENLLSPEAAFLTLDILKDTPRPDPVNSAMEQQLPVFWKTGTSSGYRDAWSVGVFGPYVLAVWIGDFQGKSNAAFIGAKTAAPLFFSMIESIVKQYPTLPQTLPSPTQLALTRIKVCETSGLLPNSHCTNLRETWFIPGKSPIKTDDIHREVAINSKTGLRTCHYDENTRWVVYEFWPSDLLKIFSQAGIQRQVPPPFETECALVEYSHGIAPKIISPQKELSYTLRLKDKLNQPIFFSAIADGDVKKLYWFVNNNYLGVIERDKNLAWQAKSGKYTVRVIDDHGRADSMQLVVENID